MTDITPSDELFFAETELDRGGALRLVEDALVNADDGELFLEYRQSESLVFDDGQLRTASFDVNQGFGLRAVSGETSAYAHSAELSKAALARAADTVRSIHSGTGSVAAGPPRTNLSLYRNDNPVQAMSFEDKVRLLQEVDEFTRNLDDRIRQVTVSLSGEWQAIDIMRPGGQSFSDRRPLVRFNVSVVTSQQDKSGSGNHGMGGRTCYADFVSRDSWHGAAREALRQSLVSLDAEEAPAGEMDVVLGPGWPGILLHEAIGHGLEGDFNRKKTSAFAGLMGERVASPGITIVDDGTLHDRRGSLSIDDEGTPAQKTTLIEDGILVGYMQDRMNGRLMGERSTGNGRRQSYAHHPMPRMTNTVMMNGNDKPQEIMSSIKSGLYAVSFGGGQVDITSGKFVFSCTEAYRIEDGKIGAPVKGATLIGNGPDALTRISMVGDDMQLDPGIGTCGKDGQGVPVGVGQPTVRLDRITVGALQPERNAMSFTTIIFDFDGVMSDYNAPDRLSKISRISGLSTDTIYERIWASGFENSADCGKYRDATAYLSAFNKQLGFELSRDDWIASRAAAMQYRADMHRLVSDVGKNCTLAMLTNNGPLTKVAFKQLAPKSAKLFGNKAFFSYEFGIKKPDGQIYRRVAAMLGSNPDQCLFVDDKPRNCDGAARVGMTAIVFKDIDDLRHRLSRLDVLKGAT